MKKFYKYSGSGNDFILIDNLENSNRTISPLEVKKWCKRREGIGADGVIVLLPSREYDFKLRIWNGDGSEAEMCGNAARSSIHYISKLRKISKSEYTFETMNGVYEGSIVEGSIVKVKMTELYDVGKVDVSDFGYKNSLYLNTGVPHAVIQVSSVDDVDITSVGSAVRSDDRFNEGTNVDFFEVLDSKKKVIKLRVFERGVEDETLCCGTGVIATAVACSKFFDWSGEIVVHTRGGVMTAIIDSDLKDLYFQGEVSIVFSGELDF